MPDIELKRLRDLRHRAEELVSTLTSDMKSFRHQKLENGFLRKPTSISDPDDVNITTTASCLMSLALAGKLPDFYDKEKWADKVSSIFESVVQKPWMSSGLSENNAFTTALVVRLFGFLHQAKALSEKQPLATLKNSDNAGVSKDKEASKEPGNLSNGETLKDAGERFSRKWEAQILVEDLDLLIPKLLDISKPFSVFLLELLPRALQKRLKSYKRESEKDDKAKLERDLVSEFTRLINTSSFFDEARLQGVDLSPDALAHSKQERDSYATAHLNRLILHDYFRDEISPLEKKSIQDIAVAIADNVRNFKINDYPPAAAVVYWFVDGVDRGNISLSSDQWKDICQFAAKEFDRQRSRFDARHAAMMDPVAMAMAACLCARLRTISRDLLLGSTKEHQAILPSTIELESSVADLFVEQTGSGIWPKYFPLFHYQEAGSNFCFTFELLEAILVEFSGQQNHLFTRELVISGLEKAVSYCELNRLHCSQEDNARKSKITYQGWNSGGELESLRQNLPESWATAVVHMFLFELIEVLSEQIQYRILLTYAASEPKAKWNDVSGLLDIDLWMERKSIGLKEVLRQSIIATFNDYHDQKSKRLRRSPVNKLPISALLFGPPGTSKTEVAKAIAKELTWPLIEIDPSTFLQDGFQNLYVRAEVIFKDVMDLAGVVVLFDEMDALVQKRDGATAIDTEGRFLTTYMLPKLAKLHDKGQIVFLMATNFQATFDDAIKRAGRFDFLLCMGPPKVDEKCGALYRFFDLSEERKEDLAEASETLRKYTDADPSLSDQLSLYTYGEFKSFITGFGTFDVLNQRLTDMGQDGFVKAVAEDSENVGLKLRDLEHLLNGGLLGKKKRLSDLDQIQLDESTVQEKKLDPKLPAVKYLIDRQQTRRQCSPPNWDKIKPFVKKQ